MRRLTAIRSSWSYHGNAINATLYEKLNFNFIRDIAPVASIMRVPLVMVVIHRSRPRRFPSSSPTPRPIRARSTWRRPATGHAQHMAGELFKMMTGVDMVHVPYRGEALALTDLLGGQVQVMFAGLSVSIEHIKAGKLRALAVTTAMRFGDAAGHPDRGRVRAGLRGERNVWPRRAEKHAR